MSFLAHFNVKPVCFSMLADLSKVMFLQTVLKNSENRLVNHYGHIHKCEFKWLWQTHFWPLKNQNKPLLPKHFFALPTWCQKCIFSGLLSFELVNSNFGQPVLTNVFRQTWFLENMLCHSLHLEAILRVCFEKQPASPNQIKQKSLQHWLLVTKFYMLFTICLLHDFKLF